MPRTNRPQIGVKSFSKKCFETDTRRAVSGIESTCDYQKNAASAKNIKQNEQITANKIDKPQKDANL